MEETVYVQNYMSEPASVFVFIRYMYVYQMWSSYIVRRLFYFEVFCQLRKFCTVT